MYRCSEGGIRMVKEWNSDRSDHELNAWYECDWRRGDKYRISFIYVFPENYRDRKRGRA